MRWPLPLICLFAAGLPSSAGVSPFDPDACVAPRALPVVQSEADGRRFVELSVLTYNVEGLPWPVRQGRGPALARIGKELARMRDRGTAPDVVVLQEAFTEEALAVAARAGYPVVARGPGRLDGRRTEGARINAGFLAAKRLLKGEGMPNLLGSGLLILSEFPLIAVASEPFSPHSCAGYDCLSNKGMLMARLHIAGVPQPVDIVTTHLNSRGSAGVAPERSREAHRYQIEELMAFVGRVRGAGHPLIMAGDFNMLWSLDRYTNFEQRVPYRLVHQWCLQPGSGCDIRLSWKGDAPWLDTQDLQLFDGGLQVALRPTRVEAMFASAENGGRLSDHDGFKVVYRLAWTAGAEDGAAMRAAAAAAPVSCAGGAVSAANSWGSRA